jgi:rSAM/selenodomain-associated transferase 1
MTTPAVLVLAKAPVPGRVKTRLAASVGDRAAAWLAQAALHDTLDACEAAVGARRCFLALDGDLADAAGGWSLAARLDGWTAVPQRGSGLGQRLVHAHADAAALAEGSPVLQVGMDTPQATPELLRTAADLLDRRMDAVLGPADDGGWWLLGVRHPRWAEPLAGVAMSTARTGADTRAALEAAGADVGTGPRLRDVDTVADAAAVAAAAPCSRFAACWTEVAVGAAR